jgi:hypothetical protein
MTTAELISERLGQLDPTRQHQALEYIEWLVSADRRQAALAQIRRSREALVAAGDSGLDRADINAEVAARRGERT